MIFNRSKKLRIISFLVILLTMVAVPLVGVGDLPAQAAEPGQLAPMNAAFLEFWQNPRPEPFYGYIPPPVDLSYLDEIPVERTRGLATFPSSFDWRDQGKVTSVKDQNPCGTCWCFGTTSAVESRVLIEESIFPPPDYSEQNLACCTDPAWVYLNGNRCMAGGWAWLAADTLIKKGTRLESCDPYNTGTIDYEACDDTCQSIKMATNYCTVADQATSPDVIEPIKNAIYNHGPVAMSYCHEDSYMDAGNIYYWPGCAVNANHLVCIVGWDDGIAHPADGGYGAWIVKNSWGTGWGNSGYFYLCFGSANMCEVASFDYKDYDSAEQLYSWDEAGMVNHYGWGDYSGWMASVFTSSQDGNLTHVDFWTTSNNAQYAIHVHLDDDPTDGLDSLATSQSGTCAEFGYYSILLDSPVPLNSSQPFTIAVEVTTPGYIYPIPGECEIASTCDPLIQTGVCFVKHLAGDSWEDAALADLNTCLRARVMSAAAGEPDITVSPTSFEETLLPDTSQDYTLNIGNTGDATLTYTISEDCSWLSQEPTSGSVAPGDPADSITVSINTAGLSEGDYTANIVIDNNDPDENPKIVPVTLHVSNGNNPPNTPSNPSPADDATGVSINADLSWTGGDPDSGDTVTYDVHFGTSVSPPLVSNNQAAITYDPGILSYNTKYYWKIVATDNHAAFTSGPLWDFTTEAEAGRKGDFTGDGHIDIFDFVHFAAAYDSELGDDNYNPIGDFDNDSDIDIYDFVHFAAVYGT